MRQKNPSPRYIVSISFLALALVAAGLPARAGDAAPPAAPAEPSGTASKDAAAPEGSKMDCHGLPAETKADAGTPAGGAAPEGSRCTLSVPGMHCGGCASKVKRIATAIEGVKGVEARIDDREVDVVFDAGKTSPEKIREVVSAAYEATIATPGTAVDADAEKAPPAEGAAATEASAPEPAAPPAS